ncbi:hypothetical protein [Fictibacillus macauensis]|nr:hypothetical protein [Fictibacillus macauensis]
MKNEQQPILTDEFLKETAKDINEEYGWDSAVSNEDNNLFYNNSFFLK